MLFDDGEKERIYRTYQGLVADAVSWKLSGIPKEEVEEVVSSLWAKLFAGGCAKLKSYGGKNGAQFPTWLAKVARNAATDYLRKKRIVSVPIHGYWDDEEKEYSLGDFLRDRSPDPLERLVAREVRKELLLAVKGLPKIYRQVVYARFYQGWSVPETAATYGIDEDTVYVRFARAFAKLRKELERRGIVHRFLRPGASSPPARSRRSMLFERDTPMPTICGHRHFSQERIVRLLDGNAARGAAGRSIGPSAPPPERPCFSCWSRLFHAALLWEMLSSLRGPTGSLPSA